MSVRGWSRGSGKQWDLLKLSSLKSHCRGGLGQLVPVLFTRMVRLTSPLHSFFAERAAAGECASSAVCGGPLRSPRDGSPNGSRNICDLRPTHQIWQPATTSGAWRGGGRGASVAGGRRRRAGQRAGCDIQGCPQALGAWPWGSSRCLVSRGTLVAIAAADATGRSTRTRRSTSKSSRRCCISASSTTSRATGGAPSSSACSNTTRKSPCSAATGC